MLTNLSKLPKSSLIAQLKERLEQGHYVLVIPKFAHDFKEFGFEHFTTLKLSQIDEVIYCNEITATLFHEAYSTFTIEYILSLVEGEDEFLLNSVLSFGRH